MGSTTLRQGNVDVLKIVSFHNANEQSHFVMLDTHVNRNDYELVLFTFLETTNSDLNTSWYEFIYTALHVR